VLVSVEIVEQVKGPEGWIDKEGSVLKQYGPSTFPNEDAACDAAIAAHEAAQQGSEEAP
jgi:hypothetical protein